MQEQPKVEFPTWNQAAVSLDEMQSVGCDIAKLIFPGCVVYFEGGLGAGKTTLIQKICQELKVDDTVLSPTFSILKPYISASGMELLHVDLYRVENPAELLLIGIEDFQDTDCVWLIEWPNRGFDVIPPPDIRIQLSGIGSSRKFCMTREANSMKMSMIADA